MGKMTGYSGHATLIDGSRVPLSEAEAEEIWQAVKQAQAKRAADMPIARDALAAINTAQSRMNDLGWWLGGGLRVKRGDECAVAQTGSTGIWRGRIDDEGQYVHFGNCVSDPRKCWLKPLADLTDEERAWMEECDRREALASRAELERLAALSSEQEGRE
jgi:hypothetical protein